MKNLVMGSIAAVVLAGVAAAGDIVIPDGPKPFKVDQDDVVRIPVEGIAGMQVKVKVVGPAKDKVNSVRKLVGGRPVIGPGNQEIELTPSGKGKVEVELTITPPNGPGKTEKYEFTVE